MKTRVTGWVIVVSILGCCAGASRAGSSPKKDLRQAFQELTRGFDGRVGICAGDDSDLACVNQDQRFALQSVMKLLVSLP